MPRPKKEKPNRADQRYEVKVTVSKSFDGKAVRKSFYSYKSKADAQAQADKFLIDQAAARLTGHSFVGRETNFAKWAKTWLETYKKPTVKANSYESTYRSATESHLIPYFGHADMDSITPADVRAFFTTKGKTLSLETLKKLRMCLNSIFETAIENDLCIKNPVVKSIKLSSAKPPPVKIVYNTEHYETALSWAKAQPDGLGLRTILETGVSRSELLGLHWEDFEPSTNTLYITQGLVEAKDPDTHKRVIIQDGVKTKYRTRSIPIPSELSAAIDAIRPVDAIASDSIFTSPTGLPWRPNNWYHRYYLKIMERLREEHPELPRITAHELRHTRATVWKNEKVDLFTIAKTIGHGDLNMLAKRYAHDDLEVRRTALGLSPAPEESDDN